jgi:hypothetical protein
MILPTVLFVVVVSIVAYLTMQYMKKGKVSTGFYDLTKSKSVIPNESLPWNMTTPSSLRFAVYINLAPKTITNVNCTTSDDTTTLTQSCTEYAFTRCKCNSINDCSNCMPDSYLASLLSLGSCVNFMVSGYVAESDKPLVSTLLTIKTASSSNTHIETIALPAIPLQKWTVITLVQEGRRIDVYYGSVSVASLNLKYLPVPAASTDSWKIGGMNGWDGKIGLFSTSLVQVTSTDVLNDVSNLVDTTGMPYSENDIAVSFDLGISSCIFGNCSGLPPIKAPNPFTVYASSLS